MTRRCSESAILFPTLQNEENYSSLVGTEADGDSTWGQHTDKYIGNIVESDAVKFEDAITQSDVDKLRADPNTKNEP